MNEEQNTEETLQGTVEEIVFHNANNGWTVLALSCGGELVTVVGEMAEVAAGDEVKATGAWVTHPSYGRQFRAEALMLTPPQTAEAALKYLSSGALHGVGPATAKQIIERFGDNALDVLENNPLRLTALRGISKQKAERIGADFKLQFGMRACMLFLQKYHLTAAECLRVWKRFGPQAVDTVRANPYALCGAGIALGFDRADRIARDMGLGPDEPARLRAGVLHVLRHNLFSGGHTYIPADKLLATAAKLLDVPTEEIVPALETLASGGEIKTEELEERQAVFLPESYAAESYIAGRLQLWLKLSPPVLGDCDARIKEAEECFGIAYAEKQREAITTACNRSVMVLTGGPGTGKTTTINAIIRIYESMGLKVALAAPTGRAAKRMAEVSGKEAKTIHRMLEMEYGDDDAPHFARDDKNPLDCDALIVDELSMVDVLLFEALLRALRLSCRLVLVGDADQLPPVGAGNALRDMIASGRVPCVELTEIFRQAAKSAIVLNAHRIVRGEQPALHERGSDFFFMQRYTPGQVKSTVLELVEKRLPAAYGYSALWDIQVLTPGRRGELGSEDFNPMLQQALNPPGGGKAEMHWGGRVFRLGDKVMQIRNDYNIPWRREGAESGSGVFNGDIGVLSSIDRRTGAFEIRFDDRTASYAPESLEEIDLAYAITVHKSQGSEFRAVVLPLFTGAPQLFYRNLLYTAVTRARELAVLVGREGTVQRMVENDRKTHRYSALGTFLQRDLV